MRGQVPTDFDRLAIPTEVWAMAPCLAWHLRRIAACLLAASCVLVMLPSAAEAERCEDGREASRHKRRGWKLRQADPEAAADEFAKAHKLCPDPWYLGHMAAAYEKAGRVREAIDAIDAYLGYEEASRSEAALEARRRLRDMLPSIEVVTEPPGASILVDGDPPERRDRSPVTLEVDPGVHVIEVDLAGFHPGRERVDVEVGEHRRVEVVLEPDEDADVRRDPAPDPEPDPGERSWGGGAQLGLGAAFPLGTDRMGGSFALLAEVGGGLAMPALRIEGIFQLALFPDTSGTVVHLSVGPRLGIKLGSLPLHLEVELTLGLHALVVSAEGRTYPQGTRYTFGLAPALSLAWQATSAIEVVARPCRIELTDVGASEPYGLVARYGFDVAVRYRF